MAGHDISEHEDFSFGFILGKPDPQEEKLPGIQVHSDRRIGGCGKGNFEGNGRQIVWHLYSDFPDGLSGNDFYFQVSATLLNGGGASWLYYVGGVILVGGAAAAVLYKSDLIGKSGSIPFPAPPGRP